MTSTAPIERKNLLQRGLNRVLHKLARALPGSTSLRPALHRLRGVGIGPGVFIGEEVYLENEYPELIEIGEGTAIGLRSVIIAHTGWTGGKTRETSGRVVIGKDVWIGACSFIAASPGASLTIGDGAVIGACSVIINKNIASHAFVLPPNARQIGTARVPFTRAHSYRQLLAGLRAGPNPSPDSNSH